MNVEQWIEKISSDVADYACNPRVIPVESLRLLLADFALVPKQPSPEMLMAAKVQTGWSHAYEERPGEGDELFTMAYTAMVRAATSEPVSSKPRKWGADV